MTANATAKAAPTTRTRKAATPKAAPKPTAEAPVRADLQDKAPSELHKNLLAFAAEQTGIADLDLKTVQVVLALHGAFQKSDANQTHLQDRKSAWAAAKAKRDADAAAAKKARLAKLAAELGVEVKP